MFMKTAVCFHLHSDAGLCLNCGELVEYEKTLTPVVYACGHSGEVRFFQGIGDAQRCLEVGSFGYARCPECGRRVEEQTYA